MSAAGTQASAAKSASNVEMNMFADTASRLSPWLNGGRSALSLLEDLTGATGNPNTKFGDVIPNFGGMTVGQFMKPFTATDFQGSPGFKFQMDQGINAIDNSAAAKGFTGNTLKDLMTYGQGLANQDYYNAANLYRTQQQDLFDRLFNLSSGGQNAAA